ISGLPEGTPIASIGSQIVKFRLRHLAIKVMFGTRQVFIIDVLSKQRLRIDLQLQQLCWETVTVQSQGGERLLFNDPRGGYRGILFSDRHSPRLELEVQGVAQAIAIAF
ncbi:MAG: hypothetical protein SVX43_18355, partial [Cyanobacteriota bacterium]|nr:hypothetical protein [Cyanobacteriota bacterium]